MQVFDPSYRDYWELVMKKTVSKRVTNLLKFIGLFIFSIGALTMPHSSSAQEITLTHEIFLERGALPQPNAIVRTQDNGFVVAGNLGKEGWVVRTDAEGKVKWRYTLPSTDKSIYGSGPIFYSAAMMSDDSVFLCGSTAAIHLDKDGHLLGQLDIGLMSCIPSDDGLIAIGPESHIQHVEPTADHPLPYNEQNFYRIVSLDNNGQVKWDKLIPALLSGIYIELTAQLFSDNTLLFAAPRMDGTEIVQLNSGGDIINQRILSPNLFRIVRTVSASTPAPITIQLVSSTTDKLTLITLNNNLQEMERLTNAHGSGTLHDAWKLPNQSFVFFGTKEKGQMSWAQIMHFDPSLRHGTTLELAPQGGSYWINAATPLAKTDEFACVRQSFKPVKNEALTSDKLDNTEGVVIDFIKVN
jgi:hypothetical protein